MRTYIPDVHPAKHVEDVPLVHVHRDQRLELGPLHLVQVLGRLADQRVQHVQELVVRLLHDLAIRPGLQDGRLGVAGPHHLDTQDAHL